MSGFNMNISIKGIDTSYPSLSTGEHRVLILGIEPKESAKTPGLWSAKVNLETLEPTTDAKGKTLDPGFKFSTNLTLPGDAQPEHNEMRQKALAAFVDACLKTDAATRPDFSDETAQQCINKQVRVIVKASKDTTFGETEVKGFKAIEG